MATFRAPYVASDALASRISYVWPEGDANIVESRQQVTFKAEVATYAPGSVATISVYSNGQCLDLSSSWIEGYLTISLTGNAPQIRQYDALKPILANGVQDLISEWRVRSYGGVDMEYIRRYNYVNAMRSWVQPPRDNVRARGRIDLRGDCLRPHEKFRIMDITNNGTSYGVFFCFRPEMSGFWSTERFLPLRYMNQVQFQMTLEKPEQAFHCQAGFFPSGSATSSVVSPPSISYTLRDLQLRAVAVTLSPEMELALEKAVNEKDGIPLFFDTFEVQMDNISNQSSYTQKIGKAVANAVRAMCMLQPSFYQNNVLGNSFASEPMGLMTYQFRLGTTYYPRDKVFLTQNQDIRACVEADMALGYPLARRESPSSTVLEQVGASAWFNAMTAIPSFGTITCAATNSTPSVGVSSLHQPFSCNQFYPPWVAYGTNSLRRALNTTVTPDVANMKATAGGSTAPTQAVKLLQAGSLGDASIPSMHITSAVITGYAGGYTAAVGATADNTISAPYDVGVCTGPVNGNRSQAAADASGLLSDHGFGSATDKERNYQLYLSSRQYIPTKFLFGTSLQMSPEAWVTGVALNHGHQLEVAIERYPPPSVNYPWLLSFISSSYPLDAAIYKVVLPNTSAVGVASVAYASATTSLFDSSNGGLPTGIPPAYVAKSPAAGSWVGPDPQHGACLQLANVTMRLLFNAADNSTITATTGTRAIQKNSSIYSWGSLDQAWLITFLQYTRLILIKKGYNIQIRE